MQRQICELLPYPRENNLNHKTIMVSYGKRITGKVYHVQNVNNTDKRIRDLMRPKKGVVTKYFQKIKNITNKLKRLATIIFKTTEALQFFRTRAALQHLYRIYPFKVV